MAVIGHAEEPSIVANQMPLVFNTLEVSEYAYILQVSLLMKRNLIRYVVVVI